MAHFAKLNSSGVVIDVTVIGNSDCLDADNNESEAVGIAFCKSLFGDDTIWKQTQLRICSQFDTIWHKEADKTNIRV